MYVIMHSIPSFLHFYYVTGIVDEHDKKMTSPSKTNNFGQLEQW